MMESDNCLSIPEAQAKLLDCIAEFLTNPAPNGRMHTNFQPFAAASFLRKLAVVYHNILKQSTNSNVSAIKAHESFQELCRDIEESVKINSRHARKCYANFMASMFKIIGRFLEHQLTKSAAFDIPLLRRTVNDLDTVLRTAMRTNNTGDPCIHGTADAFLKSALGEIIAKTFSHIGDTVVRSVILNSMFILRNGGKEVQEIVSRFKIAGAKELLAGPESKFFQNVKNILRQHMAADTETTTSTFDVKCIVATCDSRDFPLHDNGKKGVFFRKQWGCTIFRGDSKTPLTLLPKEIALAKKKSATSVCLTVSRDTLDACGVHMDDFGINDGDEVKLTITLMSTRSMGQFLREVSNMSTGMGKKAPKCKKTLVFFNEGDKQTPVSAKSTDNKKSFAKPAQVKQPKRASKTRKQAISPTGQATLTSNQNVESKKPRQSRTATKETRARVRAADPLQKVHKTEQKVADSHNKSTKSTKKADNEKNEKAYSRRSKSREKRVLPSKVQESPQAASYSEPQAELKKKRVLPSKAKAKPDVEKKRSKNVSRSQPKAITSRNQRVSLSEDSSPVGFTSDSSEDSGDTSEDLSDSDDSVNLSDSSDESDLSAKSQTSGDKSKKISFTQNDSPNSGSKSSPSSNSSGTLADLDGDSSPDSNTGSDLDSDSDSDSDFAELLKIAVSQKQKRQKQQKEHEKQQQKRKQQQKEQQKQKQKQQQKQKDQRKQQQKPDLGKHGLKKNEHREPKIIKRDRDNTKASPEKQLSKKRRIAVIHKSSQLRGQMQSRTKTLPPSSNYKAMETIKPLAPTCSLLERLKIQSPTKQKQTIHSKPTTNTDKETCQFVTERMQIVISTLQQLKKQTRAFDMAVRDAKARQVAKVACDALKIELQTVIQEQQVKVLQNIEEKKKKLCFARHQLEASMKRIKGQLKSLLAHSEARHTSFLTLLELEPLETRVSDFETNLQTKSAKQRATVAAFVKATATKAKKALTKLKTDDARKRALMLATLQAAESEEESDY